MRGIGKKCFMSFQTSGFILRMMLLLLKINVRRLFTSQCFKGKIYDTITSTANAGCILEKTCFMRIQMSGGFIFRIFCGMAFIET